MGSWCCSPVGQGAVKLERKRRTKEWGEGVHPRRKEGTWGEGVHPRTKRETEKKTRDQEGESSKRLL